MKPIRLSMQAFGPYLSVEEVDFTKFNQGLFLITGPTGSGKSTIFDALCFALYNEASGEYKESKMFRSDFAKEDLETWVKLDFSHQGKQYSVYRKPSYLRKKKKSDDYTIAQGEATLTVDGQLIYSGLNEVTRAIEELLKVKASQFKQIVMIAQGEFLKLLLTKSDERMSIYRKLFNTQVYADFSLRLKEEFLKIEKTYQGIKEEFDKIKFELNIEEAPTSLNDYVELLRSKIESLYVQKEGHIKQYQLKMKQQSSAQAKYAQAEETAQLVEKLNHIKEDYNRLVEVTADYDIKRRKLKELDYLLKEIKPLVGKTEETRKNYKDTLEQLKQLNTMIAEYEQDIEKHKSELRLLNEQKVLIAEEKIMIHTLSEQIKQYELYDINKAKLLKSETELSQELKNKANLNEKSLMIIQQIDQQRAFILLHNSVQEKMALCVHTLKQLEEEEKNYGHIADLTNKREIVAVKLSQAIATYDQCSKRYDEYARHFYASQAGLLAEKLVENEACPVCGSTQHPLKAQLTSDVVSKETLDEYSNIKDKAQESLRNESEYLNTIDHDLEHYQGILLYENKALFDKALKEQEALKELYENQAQQLQQTLIKQQNDEEELKNIQIEQSINDQAVKTKENECLVLKTVLADATVKFAYQSQNETQTMLSSVQSHVSSYEKNKQTLEIVMTETNTKVAKCRGQYASIELLNQGYSSNLKELEQELNERFPEISDYQVMLEETKMIETLRQSIEAYDQELNESSTKIKQLEALIANRQTYNLNELKEEIEQLIKAINILNLEKEAINLEVELKERYFMRLEHLLSAQGDLEVQYALYKPLSDTANANIAKKARINFEIFVQGMYFMEVLEAANIRLHKMTLARFTLKMRNSSGFQSVSGLDIEVFDEYTGKSRDVKTLSGGESFMASLSLALGLSDVIAQKAAGIELECIFIDEGFGTLDTQTLEQALGLLQELVTQNRLVGIISHVDTLKQRIDQKIEIVKEYKGSTLHQVL